MPSRESRRAPSARGSKSTGAKAGTAPSPAPPDGERRLVAAQIEAWKAEGLDVTTLERALAGDPNSALKILLQYSQAVERIRELRPAIEALPRRGQEERIQWALNALSRPLQLAIYEADIREMLGPPPVHPVRAAAKPAAPARAIIPARPRGFTNGLSSLPSSMRGPRAPPGHTNGAGRTNGAANRTGGPATPSGKTNGLVNGLRQARSGLTNGLTNPTGLTNGLGARRYAAEARSAKWKVYVIAVASFGLLLAPLLGVSENGVGGSLVNVDGALTEWSGLTASRAQHGVDAGTVADIDLIETGFALSHGRFAGYARVRGNMLSGDVQNQAHDTVRIFMDADSDDETGYRVSGLGAESMVEVTGVGGTVDSALLYGYERGGDGVDWNAWRPRANVDASVAGSNLEFELPVSFLDDQAPTRLSAILQRFDGAVDESDTNLAITAPRLLVSQESIARLVIPGGGREDFLRLVLEARDGPVVLQQLRFDVLGSVDESELTYLPTLRDVGPVATGTVSGGSVVFPMAVTISPGSVATYTLSAGTGVATSDRTLGFALAVPSDVTVESGAVSLRTLPAVRGLSHITSIPSDPRVDGGFGDWVGAPLSSGEASTKGNSNVDLVAVGSQVLGTEASAFAQVAGELFAGLPVPVSPTRRLPSTGIDDADRDTVPDGIDPFPMDFDNDGNPDTASPGDLDQDSEVDYPAGPDLFLETTLPPAFPTGYAGRSIRVYIGPITRPTVTGADTLRVYWDIDAVPSQGYSIGGIYADYMFRVSGKDGHVLESLVLRFPAGALPGDGSAWTELGPLLMAKDQTHVEMAANLGPVLNSSLVLTHFEIEDALGGKDSAMDLLTRSTRGGELPRTRDIAGNQRYFFRSTAATPSVCTANLEASTTAGSSATSTTLTNGQTLCFYTATAPGNYGAGPWEVILDVDEVSNHEVTLLPNANGDQVDWTVSGCAEANEWQCVDDEPNDGDTTYLTSSSATAGFKSVENLNDFTAPSPLSVNQVNVTVSCRKTASPATSVANVIRESGTNAFGTNTDCANSGTYTTWMNWFPTRPAGGPWTDASLDALQAGCSDSDTTTRTVRCSSAKVVVNTESQYSVEVRRCDTSTCSSTTNVYGPATSITYGSDVTFTSGSLAAQNCGGSSCRMMWIVKLDFGGSVRVGYNGPDPGSADSRATTPAVIPGYRIDAFSNADSSLYNHQRKVSRAGDVSGDSACDASNSDGCWYDIHYDQLVEATATTAPSTDTETTGTQVSGTFPTDVATEDGAYVRYRETTSSETATIVYRSNTGTNTVNSPKTRLWNGASWTVELELSSAGSPIRDLRMAASPTSSTSWTIVSLSDDGQLDAYVCTPGCAFSSNVGTVWSGAPVEDVKRFDVAYEPLGGDVMLIYSVLSADTTRDLAYKVYSGGFWGAEQYLDDTGHATDIQYGALDLAVRKGTDQIGLIGKDDTNNDANAWIWGGSSWSSMTQVSGNVASNPDRDPIAIAWETYSGHLMAAARQSGTNVINTMEYTTSWASVTSGDCVAANVYLMDLRPNPVGDDMILIGVDPAAADLCTLYWTGTAWANGQTHDADIDWPAVYGRPADFAWENSGSKGLLVWGTTSGQITYRTFTAPNTWGAVCNGGACPAMGANLHPWVSLETTNSVSGNRILGAVLEETNLDLGGLRWDGTTFTVIGASTFTADVSIASWESFDLDVPIDNNDQLSISHQWSGTVPAGDSYTLNVKGYREDESILVQAFTPPSTWTTKMTISSTSNTLYTATLTTAEYNTGSPTIRFIDADGGVGRQSDVFLDLVTVSTNSLWDRILLSRSLDVTGVDPWGTPVILASGRAGDSALLLARDSNEPSIALDASGYLHVTWVSANAAGNQATMDRVRYSRTTVAYPTQAELEASGNWEAVTNVDDTNLGLMPTVSVDTSGNPHVAWSASRTSGSVFYKNKAGGTWRSTVSWGATLTGNSVDVSPQNNQVSLARYFEGGTNEIRYTVCKDLAVSNCDASAEFTKWDGTAGYDTVATAVETTGYPSLVTAYGADGDLWVAYAKDVDGTTRAIYARNLDYPAGGWAAAETVHSVSGWVFTKPSIGIDSEGDVHALYVYQVGPQIYYRERDPVWIGSTLVGTASTNPSILVRAPSDATYGGDIGAMYWKTTTSETYHYYRSGTVVPEFTGLLVPLVAFGFLLAVRVRGRRRHRQT